MANRLTERHARTLLRIQDPRLQLQLIDQIRRESLSVKATEDLVERILDKQYYDQEHLHKKRISGFMRDGRLLMNDIKSWSSRYPIVAYLPTIRCGTRACALK